MLLAIALLVVVFLVPGYVVTRIEDSGARRPWPRWLDLPTILIGASLWFGAVAGVGYLLLR